MFKTLCSFPYILFGQLKKTYQSIILGFFFIIFLPLYDHNLENKLFHVLLCFRFLQWAFLLRETLKCAAEFH